MDMTPATLPGRASRAAGPCQNCAPHATQCHTHVGRDLVAAKSANCLLQLAFGRQFRARSGAAMRVGTFGVCQSSFTPHTKEKRVQILDILRASQGGSLNDTLATAFGLEPKAAKDVSGGLVEELSRALERNTLSRGGVSDLIEMVGQGGHTKYLDDDANLASAETKQDGDALLAQILGTKHQSRGVAARVGRQTGVAPSIIEKMLPAIAAMMMGGVEKQVGGQLGDLTQRFGGGSTSLAPQQPLPVPGDNMDYGGGHGGSSGRSPFDDLSDMIRRGGRTSRGGRPTVDRPNGSMLGQMVRQIFGNLLGFQSKGIVGYLIQLIVFRYGWRIVKSILSRLFLGR